MVVPLPPASGDADLIAWVGQLLDQIFPEPAPVAPATAGADAAASAPETPARAAQRA
jgi:transcription-repair coupling factor (superfamily II helicase)